MPSDLPEDYAREHHDALPSTSTLAMKRLVAGHGGNLWVTAGRQTEGRGRRGRAWSTEVGNLAASLALVDPAPPAVSSNVSFVAALGMYDAVAASGPAGLADRLAIKWPNDLLLEGHKIGGILVEGQALADHRLAVVIGMGVNCVSHPDLPNGYPATDLAANGVAVSAESLFAELSLSMAQRLMQWDRGAGFASIRGDWLSRATGLGEDITVRLPDRTLQGSFSDIDPDGRLLLRKPGGVIKSIDAGDVFLTPRPAAEART